MCLDKIDDSAEPAFKVRKSDGALYVWKLFNPFERRSHFAVSVRLAQSAIHSTRAGRQLLPSRPGCLSCRSRKRGPSKVFCLDNSDV